MSKKLLLLLALAVLLGVSVFSLWKQSTIVTPPTPEPVVSPESTPEPTPSDQPIDTSDWKTYRNEEYGFELSFPKNWNFSEKAGDNGDRSAVSLVSPETKTLMEEHRVSETCDLSFYYYDSITSEPENRDQALTIENMVSQNELVKKIGMTTLGGIDAMDVVWGGNGAYYSILALKNKHLYKVWSCSKERPEQLSSTEKRIIDSFKFIETK